MRFSKKQFMWSIWTSGACLLTVLYMGTNGYFQHLDNSVKSQGGIDVPHAQATSSHLPLYFEENIGQLDPKVKFLSRGQGYTFYFTPQEVVMGLKGALEQEGSSVVAFLSIQFIDAEQNPRIAGVDLQECKTHYYKGNDPAKWQTNVPNFAKVRYANLYPGIDAVFYGNQNSFEYDIAIAPGRDPQGIRLRIEGAQELSIDSLGNLCMHVDEQQQVQMNKPIVYQEMNGGKVFVDGEFVLLAENTIGFTVGAYDPMHPLIIDPLILYSSFLGGNSDDQGNGIAVDNAGNSYIVGFTSSSDFPTKNPLQANFGGQFDAFITKVNATGSALIYSTYLGGSALDIGAGIALDGNNNAYITGTTESADFPTTPGAFQTASLSVVSNAFVTKISAEGALSYSTYLGGSSLTSGNAIAVDGAGNAYVTGATSAADFPLVNPVQGVIGGVLDVFVTQFNSIGSALVYSTFLGGSGEDVGLGIALDSNANAYITGSTLSPNFPTTVGAYQTSGNLSGGTAFVAKIDSVGPTLAYSTYLGGSVEDQGNGIAVDSSGNAYITGETNSNDFPVTSGAFQTTFPGSPSTFITKMNPTGSGLVFSSYLTLGQGRGVALNASGDSYITGTDFSGALPLVNPVQDSGSNYVVEFNSTGTNLLFSTYLGGAAGNGIALDSAENIYVTGLCDDSDFTSTPGVFQPTFGGGDIDAFVIKISPRSVFPPDNLKGRQVANKFLTQTEFVNILTWTPPAVGNSPVVYKIYRNAGLTKLAGVVPAFDKLEFVDHDRKAGKVYHYWIVAVDALGNISTPATVTVQPLK